MAVNVDIRVLSDSSAVAHAAASLFVESAVDAVRARNRFRVCLSGGATPQATYSLVASESGSRIQRMEADFFFTDERCVPAGHPESNYRMVAESLFENVCLGSGRIHRIRTELGAVQAAEEYERTLGKYLDEADGRFDLVLLGMGEDGHTASLFPQAGALHVRNRVCVATLAPYRLTERVTLTFPILNRARRVVFLVEGAGKAAMLRSVLTDPVDISLRPAQGVRPDQGELIWCVDRAAASALPPRAVRP
jgi:6-phosphogluconolactonase